MTTRKSAVRKLVRLTAAACLAAGVMAVPAEAGPRKPLRGAYDVELPVPNPVPDEKHRHCATGTEGVSRSVKSITLPAAGKLRVVLSGFHGDWVLEVYDKSGKLMMADERLDPASSERQVSMRLRGKHALTIAVCNTGGTKDARVAWVFTFS